LPSRRDVEGFSRAVVGTGRGMGRTGFCGLVGRARAGLRTGGGEKSAAGGESGPFSADSRRPSNSRGVLRSVTDKSLSSPGVGPSPWPGIPSPIERNPLSLAGGGFSCSQEDIAPAAREGGADGRPGGFGGGIRRTFAGEILGCALYIRTLRALRGDFKGGFRGRWECAGRTEGKRAIGAGKHGDWKGCF